MDVYIKLLWEIDQLERYMQSDYFAPGFCALNGAITAWQLGDWTAGYLDDMQMWEIASRILNQQLRSLGDLQRAMRAEPELVVCQQMAAAGKHKVISGRTYRPGFNARDVLTAYGGSGDVPPSLTRSMDVTYPAGDGTDITRSMTAILMGAASWWEKTFRDLDIWEETKLTNFRQMNGQWG